MGVLTALVVASSALQAGSSIAQARGMRRAANDAVNEGNRLAADALARGEQEASRYQVQLDQLLGRQRTAAASQGIAIDSGSAAQVTADTQKFGAEDLTTIRENAAREAYGLKRQGQNAAKQLRTQATGAYGQAFASVLNASANGWGAYQAGRTNVLKSGMRATKWGP